MKPISLKTPNKYYGLDHFRALAILLVLIFHYQRQFAHPGWTEWFKTIGWTGVDLFYVLSGFLIASQLFKEIKKGKGISLKVFFIKRSFRILPLYFFILAVYFFFPYFREKVTMPPLWRFISFTQNFGLDNSRLGTFSHAWSLCVEEHFYLVLPLTLIFLQRIKLLAKSYWILISLFVAGIVLRNFIWNIYYPSSGLLDNPLPYWYELIYYPTYNRLDGLLVGVAIAAIYIFSPERWNKISKFGKHFMLLGLVLLIAIYFFCADLGAYATTIWGFPLISIAYGLLVIGAISPSSFLYHWNSKITTFIAVLSYALYLSHKTIIHVSQDLLSKAGIDKESNLMLLCCMAFCFLGAWVLNLAIEKPFMKIRDKIVGKKTTAPVNSHFEKEAELQ